ncbi:PREDICTED: 2-carboxy-1,4-naphthoquinone phytyltransferase, chloroplastic isoform X2 [Tarenaya hassleriana]|uniref:2-carboxy-1,4-naphthoquinone phytyltransferase, chloroplastic isoform X2 n=1 Tax=Tarenaya hassleriana TaxID=28532 RepID=UPI00053C5CF2|nr:PREDICTED: 2-carboxy-1,4-naphthoquinone phytyltransferase, chloroplastic isoform X2 [Tarenaya hassleriana]
MGLVSFCDISSGFFLKKPSFTRCYQGAPFTNSYSRSSPFYMTAREKMNVANVKFLNIDERRRQGRPIVFRSRGNTVEMCGDDKEEDVSKATLIWRAVKLPIYFVALVPLTVGGAAAYLETGSFSAGRYLTLLVSSVLTITWLNLSNDVYDFDTGADKNKKESVVNLVGSRTGTLIAAFILLVLGGAGLSWISMEARNIRAIMLLASAIFCGYIYQCPPFRLSYHGLGEPLCFAAFGPFATTAFYLLLASSSQTSHVPLNGRILSASFLVGFTTSLILLCSHFHQVESDLAVGKLSPLVRVGTERGAKVVKSVVVSLYSLLLVLGLTRILPLTCTLMCFLTLPMGILVTSYVEKNHKDKGKIFMAKYYCVRLHALFGAALSIGLVAARPINRVYVPDVVISWP